jgi:hypothetical protein
VVTPSLRAVLLRHHRHDRARIDAARQEGAERHFGFHLALHRFAQAFDQLGLDVGFRTRRRG